MLVKVEIAMTETMKYVGKVLKYFDRFFDMSGQLTFMEGGPSSKFNNA